MKFKSRTTIEINSRYIKVLQSNLPKDKPIHFAEVIAIENLSDEEIVQKLLGLKKSNKFSTNNSQIILNVSRQYTIVRYLDLPSDNKDELRSMVELQAVTHLPYAQEEIILDFIPLDKNSEGYTKVMVVAVQKKTINRLESVLESAHLRPHQITVSSVGIWQWYRKNYPMIQGVSAIVDIDYNGTEICFCDQNKILMSRSTALGVKELETKQYDQFFEQLDWTMSSYVKEQLGHSVGQILLLSSVGSVDELKNELQKKCKAHVQSARTVQDMPVKKGFVWPSVLLQDWVSVTALLGLLQSGEDVLVDLTSTEARSMKSATEQKMQWVRLIVIFLIAIFSLVFAFSSNSLKTSNQRKSLEDQLHETQKKVSVIKKKEEQLNLLRGVINNRIVLMDVVDDMYHLLPQGVVLTNLSLNSDKILSVQGFSSKGSEINEMQKGFVDSTSFEQVNLEYVNKRVTLEGEVNYFKITMHIKTKGKGNEEAK